MTIKEVENLTGLTAKAIRYYEKEGLLHIGRNKINSYRNYSEQDVKKLKKIKIFRYLDFSIEEIKQIIEMENEKISEALIEKVEQLEEKNAKNQKKKELCLELSRDIKNGKVQFEEYEDIIKINEYEELQKEIEDLEIPSFYTLILQTFICLGPIVSLFINIKMEMWDALIMNAILAIIATIILTLNCKSYIYYYKNRRTTVKNKNKQDRFIIPALMISIILTLSLIIILTTIVEKCMAPDGWLFYEFDQCFQILMIILTSCTVIYIVKLILKKLKDKDKFILKGNIKVVTIGFVIWSIGLFICITNITFVTENSIITYSPLCLTGKEYNYDEISKVEAKFGDKIFSLNEYEKKGSFQYTIYIDERRIVFSVPTPNSSIERYNDSYLELEEFDEKLMQLNIPKESSETNSEACDLDKIYVDRFLRIIRNK